MNTKKWLTSAVTITSALGTAGDVTALHPDQRQTSLHANAPLIPYTRRQGSKPMTQTQEWTVQPANGDSFIVDAITVPEAIERGRQEVLDQLWDLGIGFVIRNDRKEEYMERTPAIGKEETHKLERAWK